MQRKHIVVGSESKHKIGPVSAACMSMMIPADVSGKDIPSLINAQPEGLEEIYRGASNRARGGCGHRVRRHRNRYRKRNHPVWGS
ncbi:MAG: DUF84 family protein [Candidatus Moranbacteria bacterium]|nr:DUF84 family protein [Candidatus Moranbacteria bacterium]